MRKILSIIMIAMLLFGFMPESVRAEEVEGNVPAEAISQDEYEGYQLKWEKYEGRLFDTLLKVTRNGELIAEYEYNEDNNRIAKSGKGGTASFTYTDDFYLDTVSDKHGTIKYSYKFKDCTNIKYMTGFLYNGTEYEFVYTDGAIAGISCCGEEIARYVYDTDYTFLKTMKKDGQEWAECTDEDFIGNINKIRFAQSYYDEETGWYYFGRYYDAANNRYLDGISSSVGRMSENSDEEVSLLSYYDTFLPEGGNGQTRMSISQEETISRVLYCEAGTSSYDWDAVAWVVYNRMVSRSMSAYQVITENNQFSAYEDDEGNHPYLDLNLNGWYNTGKWTICCENAGGLIQNNCPRRKVLYIEDQEFFASIKTFLAGYDTDGVSIQYFANGSSKLSKIKNLVIPGQRQIPPSMLTPDMYYNYAHINGQFNFYFNYYE